MNKVIIRGLNLEENELIEFEQDKSIQENEFLVLEELNFGTFAPETISLIFQLVQGIGINATYDIIKYSIAKLYKYFNKKGNENTYISVTIDGKTDVINLDFSLNDEQKDKVLNAAIEKFLGHKNG